MEWLRLGLDISDDLSSFSVNGKTITQMSIRDIKAHMSMESALKVTKAVIKASGRDFQEFDKNYAVVMRASDELPSVEDIFKVEQMSARSVDESIISLFGDGFAEKLTMLRENLKKEWWAEAQKMFNLTDDEMLVYLLFLKGIDDKEHANKIFEPFVSRIPEAFLKSGVFFAGTLSALRKLPAIRGGTYDVKTKGSVEDFRVGKSYVFPSFAIGIGFGEDRKKGEGNEVTLRIKGKTKRIHPLTFDRKSKK